MKSFLINRYLIYLFIQIALFSCTENNQRKGLSDFAATSTYYQPSKLIDSLTEFFLDSGNCNNCINEIYIDKVSLKETYITFRATTYHHKYHNEYLEKQNPLFYFTKNGQKFFIILGAEEYFIGDQNKTKNMIFIEKEGNEAEYEIILKFKIYENLVSLQKVAGTPFMPEFDQFVPHVDSSKKFHL